FCPDVDNDGWFDYHREDPWSCGLTVGTYGATDDTKHQAQNPSSTSCSPDEAMHAISHKEAVDDLEFDKEIVDLLGEDITDEEAKIYLCQMTLERSPAQFWVSRNLGDYQEAEPDELDEVNRSLALHRIRAHEPSDYNSWDEYRKIFSDYASDKEYVEYYKEMSKKMKWLKDYIGHLHSESRKWRKLYNKTFIQALKIATGYPHIFPFL
uniref:Uncharacterized protein n=1 Tax=Setaria italica TaxID=4555 RepID=K3YXY8_SETIT